MTLNASCSGFVAIYYIFGAKDAEFQIIIALGITLLSLTSFACLPESPKLRYDQGDFEGCRNELKKIAAWNGVRFDPPPFEDEIKHTRPE